MSSALPPIDNATLPADIRNGSTADQTRYKTALQFEHELVAQLTKQLDDTAQGSSDGSDGDDGSSSSTNSYKSMMPDVMADSIMQSGGLGLARQIAQNLKENGR